MTGYHYVIKLLRSLEGEAGVENHSFRRFFSIVERGSSETEILPLYLSQVIDASIIPIVPSRISKRQATICCVKASGMFRKKDCRKKDFFFFKEAYTSLKNKKEAYALSKFLSKFE